MKGVASYVLKTGKGRFELFIVHFAVLILQQVYTITYLAKRSPPRRESTASPKAMQALKITQNTTEMLAEG